jgi:hypothetical protein
MLGEKGEIGDMSGLLHVHRAAAAASDTQKVTGGTAEKCNALQDCLLPIIAFSSVNRISRSQI